VEAFVYPRAAKASMRWLPRKPWPPVTTMRESGRIRDEEAGDGTAEF